MVKDLVVNLSAGGAQEPAADFAISIAKAFNAQVSGVAFVYEPVIPATIMGGIPTEIIESQRKEIAEGLSHLLADSYTLYLKTHNFHWNVTGPMFNTLHLMFEAQYNELALAVDSIAERIRALGFPAPGTYREFVELSSLKEPKGVPSAEEMIRHLVMGQETVVKTARSILPLVDKASDEPTADLLTQRMQVHEKTAWMLRSLLEK